MGLNYMMIMHFFSHLSSSLMVSHETFSRLLVKLSLGKTKQSMPLGLMAVNTTSLAMTLLAISEVSIDDLRNCLQASCSLEVS